MEEQVAVRHICPNSLGGVDDYVDILCKGNPMHTKIKLDKASAKDIKLSGNIVLHYVGYGYAKRGAPIWLLKKIIDERKSIDKLVVWFHELYAFDPPWKSAFWLSPLQRYIAAKLFELSDQAITNRQASADWLRSKGSYKQCSVLPVPSNVGELDTFPELKEKKAIIFGGAHLRAKAYRSMGHKIHTLKELGYEIHDIGPVISDDNVTRLFNKFGIIQHGRLGITSISKLLLTAEVGVIDYPVDSLAKSGVFAAYSSYGLCPLVIKPNYINGDGIELNKHFIFFESITNIELIKPTAAEAFKWYSAHSVQHHQKLINSVFL